MGSKWMKVLFLDNYKYLKAMYISSLKHALEVTKTCPDKKNRISSDTSTLLSCLFFSISTICTMQLNCAKISFLPIVHYFSSSTTTPTTITITTFFSLVLFIGKYRTAVAVLLYLS